MISIKINWKARFKNKAFLTSFIALIISFVYNVLNLLEVLPAVNQNEMLEIMGVIINILALMGVVVDPTTKGVSDSARALTYYKRESISEGEENG